MKREGEGELLRIFIGEDDRWDGEPLYEAVMQRALDKGLAGATVLRGMEGFGAHSRMHTPHILRLSEDLPIVIEIVDKPDNIEEFIPELDEMVQEGMITREKVHITAYRSGESGEEN